MSRIENGEAGVFGTRGPAIRAQQMAQEITGNGARFYHLYEDENGIPYYYERILDRPGSLRYVREVNDGDRFNHNGFIVTHIKDHPTPFTTIGSGDGLPVIRTP